MVLHGRNEAKLKQIAEETNSFFVPGDVTRPDLAGKLLETANRQLGGCDILVNNAGVIEAGKIEEIDIDKVCEMVRVNVEAAYRMAYTFLKYFKEKNKGHVINLSSILGTKVRETAGAYAGTKFAIEALSEALRMELAGTGVKITCIEPGLVKTDLHRSWQPHPMESMNIPNPLTPEDIAETILYVLKQKPHVRIPKLLIMPGEHAL